jgi:hypothetical protein
MSPKNKALRKFSKFLGCATIFVAVWIGIYYFYIPGLFHLIHKTAEEEIPQDEFSSTVKDLGEAVLLEKIERPPLKDLWIAELNNGAKTKIFLILETASRVGDTVHVCGMEMHFPNRVLDMVGIFPFINKYDFPEHYVCPPSEAPAE